MPQHHHRIPRPKRSAEAKPRGPAKPNQRRSRCNRKQRANVFFNRQDAKNAKEDTWQSFEGVEMLSRDFSKCVA